jgi:anthranilate phosphoribosyltransferase
MAEALAGLGPERAFVVHGSDGLDEVTTTGPTLVFEVADGRALRHTWTPEDFGVPRATPEQLWGGDRDVNCDIARRILGGERGAARDIVLVNAAAALMAAGATEDLRAAMRLAAESVDSGAARGKLEALVRFTNGA